MPDAKSARPKPTKVAWVWPMIDRPRRTDDATFIDDQLEVELAPGGRLDTLIQAAKKARTPVTWAIDPALIDDAQEMSNGYTLKNAKRPKGTSRPPSTAAANWLNQLRSAGNPYFTTPYADPDTVALVRQKLGRHLDVAYRSMQIAEEVHRPATGVHDLLAGQRDGRAADPRRHGRQRLRHVPDEQRGPARPRVRAAAPARPRPWRRPARTGGRVVFDATISDSPAPTPTLPAPRCWPSSASSPRPRCSPPNSRTGPAPW